jgi:hypothetical protein
MDSLMSRWLADAFDSVTQLDSQGPILHPVSAHAGIICIVILYLYLFFVLSFFFSFFSFFFFCV